MKTVSSNSPNKSIHERIGANEGNIFGSSERNKSEEEKASKGQECRENNQNSWISNDKTKSEECMLNQPPKKPRDEEAHDTNSVLPMTCAPASIYENSGKTITDMLKKGKVPNIARMEKVTN